MSNARLRKLLHVPDELERPFQKILDRHLGRKVVHLDRLFQEIAQLKILMHAIKNAEGKEW